MKTKEVVIRKADASMNRMRVYVFDGAAFWNMRIDERKEFVLDVLKTRGIKPAKLHWSQRAGCSCGCSPGFIVDGEFGRDVFITLTR